MEGIVLWLAVVAVGAALQITSVLAYFRANPAGRYSFMSQPKNEPGLAAALRVTGFVGVFFGGLQLNHVFDTPWVGVFTIVVVYAGVAVIVLIGNRRAARRQLHNSSEGKSATSRQSGRGRCFAAATVYETG
jgi:amino acid transporter